MGAQVPIPTVVFSVVEEVVVVHGKSLPCLRAGQTTDGVECCGSSVAAAAAVDVCGRDGCGGDGYELVVGYCLQNWAT